MGYYSFYKIIKDIIRTLFGRNFFKITLIILIAFTIFFILGESRAFAVSTISNLYGFTRENPIVKDEYSFTLPDWVLNYRNIYIGFGDGYEGSTNVRKVLIFSNAKLLFDDVNNTISTLPNNDYYYWTVNSPSKVYDMTDYTIGTNFNHINTTTSYTFPVKYSYSHYTKLLSGAFYNFSDPEELIIQHNYFIKPPEIVNTIEQLETLDFEVISINAWDYSQQDLYLLCYDKNYEDTDSLYNLYPVKEILLNNDSEYFMKEITADVEENSIYWIPKEQIGFNWAIGNNYAFRFAIREPIESEFSEWAYTYLTEPLVFTVSSDVTQQKIDDLNELSKEYQEELRHNETINAMNKQTEQDKNFYNNILSDDYDENKAGDSLDGVTSSTDSIDDSEYTGLFSAIFTRFSNIVNGDFTNVEEIRYPIPNTNGEIVITSDLLSSKIQGTFIYVFLQITWYFIFGLYIFKFSNNLIRKIKDGSILNGYENNNEVITSTML